MKRIALVVITDLPLIAGGFALVATWGGGFWWGLLGWLILLEGADATFALRRRWRP